MSAAYLLRIFLLKKYVDTAPILDRSRRQFRIDLTLFISAGLVIAFHNLLVMDFPLVRSGLKLVLGFGTLGLFQAVDLSLDRERAVIRLAKKTGLGRNPPNVLFPMTRRFLYLATILTVLVAAILILVIVHDLRWLTASVLDDANMSFVVRAVIIEILFVMGVLLALVINLIVSYTLNLRLLLDNQTSVLERISQGDLSGFVPAVTNDELGFIAGHTNKMVEGLKGHLELTRSMDVAREIQSNLLPASAPDIPGLDLAGASLSCDAITGDYFDYFKFGDGHHLAVLVGDVSGHGVGSALLMASVRSLIQLRMSLPGSLADCMADVNRLMAADTFGSGSFMTLFCLVINTTTFELRWVNAGHDPALLYKPEQDGFSDLHDAGLPLGVLRDGNYAVSSRDAIEAGHVVVLGTDGIWETTDAHEEFFGKDRFKEILRQNASGTAQQILDAVTAAVAAFRGDRPQEDDITLVVIKAMPR